MTMAIDQSASSVRLTNRLSDFSSENECSAKQAIVAVRVSRRALSAFRGYFQLIVETGYHLMILSYIDAARYAGRMTTASPTGPIELAFPKGHTRRHHASAHLLVFCGLRPKVTENINPCFCKVRFARR